MSANIAVYQEKLAKLLKQPGTINDTMTLAEQKSGVQRIYIAYGVIGLVVIWLAFGMAAQLLASAIGYVFIFFLEHGKSYQKRVYSVVYIFYI